MRPSEIGALKRSKQLFLPCTNKYETHNMNLITHSMPARFRTAHPLIFLDVSRTKITGRFPPFHFSSQINTQTVVILELRGCGFFIQKYIYREGRFSNIGSCTAVDGCLGPFRLFDLVHLPMNIRCL